MLISDDVLHAKTILRSRLSNTSLLRRATLSIAAASASASSNLHALGVGFKMVKGKPTTTLCVRLYVTKKLSKSLLDAASLLPEAIDGIPTDVIESAPAFISAPSACTLNRKLRQRPLQAGISTGHKDVTAGTIAYFCKSIHPADPPDRVFMLSNNHVFANVNNANTGDAICQPGLADGGVIANDVVAKLARFHPIALGGEANPNKIDAAIVALAEGATFRRRICTLGTVNGTTLPQEDMAVQKHGRTTGLTPGRITDISYDTLVGMDHTNSDVVAFFVDQLRIESIDGITVVGLGGDSGSLIVEKGTRKAVGLYFAGPENGMYGVANPIGDVLSQLQIELL